MRIELLTFLPGGVGQIIDCVFDIRRMEIVEYHGDDDFHDRFGGACELRKNQLCGKGCDPNGSLAEGWIPDQPCDYSFILEPWKRRHRDTGRLRSVTLPMLCVTVPTFGIDVTQAMRCRMHRICEEHCQMPAGSTYPLTP